MSMTRTQSKILILNQNEVFAAALGQFRNDGYFFKVKFFIFANDGTEYKPTLEANIEYNIP